MDPAKRLDTEQALSHPWIALDISEKKNIVGHVGTNLTKHFTGKRATMMKRYTTDGKGDILKDKDEDVEAPKAQSNLKNL